MLLITLLSLIPAGIVTGILIYDHRQRKADKPCMSTADRTLARLFAPVLLIIPCVIYFSVSQSPPVATAGSATTLTAPALAVSPLTRSLIAAQQAEQAAFQTDGRYVSKAQLGGAFATEAQLGVFLDYGMRGVSLRAANATGDAAYETVEHGQVTSRSCTSGVTGCEYGQWAPAGQHVTVPDQAATATAPPPAL